MIGRTAPLLALLALPACNAITGIDAYKTPTTEGIPAAPDAREVDGGPTEASSDGERSDTELDVSPPDTDTTPDTTAPDTSPTPDTGSPTDTAPPDTGTCLTHSNGISSGTGTYAFCAPLGTPGVGSTYSLAMAEAARDSVGASTLGGPGTVCGSSLALACAKTVWGYVTWGYAGPLAGYVYVNPSACTACPTTLCPTWN